MASNDIGDWYRGIPQITKYWFTGSIIVPLIGRIGILPPQFFILDFASVFYHFNIWRPITAALYYPISGPRGFHFLMNLYFLYSYSTRLETETFAGSPADYAFMLLFIWLCLVIIGFAVNLFILMDPLVLSVLYVWCQLNKDVIVSFWFGTRFKAMYLPWVLFAFNLIIGSGGMMELFGILVGHLYFFLMFKYPQDFGGAQLLTVPNILYRFFPKTRPGMGGFGQAPASRARPDDGNNGGGGGGGWRHNWGRGQQLGN
ncbi:derlin [Plakobranchus ocellatus]|uniref:Derlin n=1 Tax=Plakobranchus ocellatus TaxID=259542 RepID=A0AAV4DH26_9GAST|nr:derlin [Plakobranchus ocellatus]